MVGSNKARQTNHIAPPHLPLQLRGVPQAFSLSVSSDGKAWRPVREDVTPDTWPDIQRQRVPVQALALYIRIDMKVGG